MGDDRIRTNASMIRLACDDVMVDYVRIAASYCEMILYPLKLLDGEDYCVATHPVFVDVGTDVQSHTQYLSVTLLLTLAWAMPVQIMVTDSY